MAPTADMTADLPPADPDVDVDEDAPGPPISVPDSGEAGEGGRLKMIVQLVKKCLGVKDIAAMRLSLPASLLEPIPNLEYWHYLDRPDLFAAINDSDDALDRMLAVLRFTFTKDLKFIHGKICKPYNSVLGEHFRSHWDITPVSYPSDPSEPPIPTVYTSPSASPVIPPLAPATRASETASVKSVKSSKSGLSFASRNGKSPSTAATSPLLVETNVDAQISNLCLGEGDSYSASSMGVSEDGDRIRVVYVTEQVSHHPPVSAYYGVCPSRNLEFGGIDQISAKVSGTTLRVSPGQFNKGIFVKITGGNGNGEMYSITHPVAHVNGILRGSFYVTVCDSTIITCTGGKGDVNSRYRAVVEYKEESWLGKAHFLLEGVIHTYKEGETDHECWTKVKHVPRSRVIAEFDGSWKQRIRWRRVNNSPRTSSSTTTGSTPSVHSTNSKRLNPTSATSLASSTSTEDAYNTLLDLSTLKIIPKAVRPLDKQLPHESRKLWDRVTAKLVEKEFGEATKEKVRIEQKQRDDAAERKRKGIEFIPRYFERDISSGVPTLTADGRRAVDEELNEPSVSHAEESDQVP